MKPEKNRIMDDTLDMSAELEQMRSDYAALKNKLESQEIISDRLVMESVRSKVELIDSQDRISIACCAVAFFLSPAYHFIFGATWWFCGATALFMAYAGWCAVRRRRNMGLAFKADRDMLPLLNKIKYFRREYANRLNVALPLVVTWAVWLFMEIFWHAGGRPAAILLSGCALAGLLIGGAIGLRMRARVIRACDAIVRQLKQ